MGSMSLTTKPNPGRPAGKHEGIDSQGRKVYRMESPPRDWTQVPIPPSKKDGTMHVLFYLRSKGCKLWERGGKEAFAKSKGKEYATENEFEELFKTY